MQFDYFMLLTKCDGLVFQPCFVMLFVFVDHNELCFFCFDLVLCCYCLFLLTKCDGLVL